MSYAEGTKTKQVGRFLFLQKYLSTNTGDQEGTLPHLSEINKKLSEKSSSDCGLVLFVFQKGSCVLKLLAKYSYSCVRVI